VPAAWLEIVFKTFVYVSLVVAVGVGTTRCLLLKLCPPPVLLSTEFVRCDAFLKRLALGSALGGLGALWGRAIGHAIVAFGVEEFGWEALRVVAFESRWGQSWQVLTISAGALTFAAALMWIHRQAGWVLFTAFAFITVLTLPLLGHAAGSPFRLFLHGAHMLALSCWLGSLGVIVLLRPRAVQIAEVLLGRFSSIALPAATVVVAAGVAASVIYLQSPANLFSSAYGTTLLLKLAAFAGVLACGYSNWRRARAGEVSRPRILHAEVLFAALVIALASVLTETEHP
jgi:putative copper export protein